MPLRYSWELLLLVVYLPNVKSVVVDYSPVIVGDLCARLVHTTKFVIGTLLNPVRAHVLCLFYCYIFIMNTKEPFEKRNFLLL